MIEVVKETVPTRTYFCNICSHEWTVPLTPVGRFASIEALVQRTGLRRDELTTLADIGALNAFTKERRSALWQVERAVRPAGELYAEPGIWFAESDFESSTMPRRRGDAELHLDDARAHRLPHEGAATPRQSFASEATLSELRVSASPRPVKNSHASESHAQSPLPPMDASERLRADYAGMGLTIGPHPMALHRDDLALRGVLRAADLPVTRHGRRVRVAGMVITRQRPGTAKGFVFLTLEDETGISNVIVRPDLYDQERMVVVRQPFLIVDGVLQHQDGVLSVRAERIHGMEGGASVDAHDFY
jgi:error-prone DNA polymerase